MALFKPINTGPTNSAFVAGERAYLWLEKQGLTLADRLNPIVHRLSKKLTICLLLSVALGLLLYFLRPII